MVGAQIPTDSWVVSAFVAGGIFVVDPAMTASTQPLPQSTAMEWANAVATDESGMVWFAPINTSPAFPNEIFWVITTPTSVVLETRLTIAAVGPTAGTTGISGLVRRRNDVWFCTLEGAVGFVDGFTAGQTPSFVPPAPIMASEYLNAIATDGREIYVAVYSGSTAPGTTIFAIDPDAPNPTWRPVADTRGGLARSVLASALTLGPDNSLLVCEFDSHCRKVDLETGATTIVNPSPLYALNGGSYNPWNGMQCVVPGSGPAPRPVDFLDVATGNFATPASINTTGAPSATSPVCEQPFTLFGRGCPGTGGIEPRLRWTGLPVGGGSADVRLTAATSNGFAFFFMGLSTSNSPLGALPLSGSAFGAPGCQLLVSPDIVVFHSTPAGSASQALSLPPGGITVGVEVFAQWAVLAAVNPLGLVTTEGVTIRMR